MICRKCGSFIPDGSTFCTQCGTPVAQEQPASTYQQPDNNQASYQQSAPSYQQSAPVYQQSASSYQQPVSGFTQGTAAAPKKKSKTGVIVLLSILSGVFFLLAVTTGILLVESYEENELLAWENDQLEDDLYDAKAELAEKQEELTFYETYAAIVPDDGGYRYHVYGCDEYSSYDSFWIYNIDLAEGNGYYACPYCH